jgi:membrane protease YdiL (CAAX protease family)
MFAVINPFFEEVFWRGLLLKKLPLPAVGRVLYSTAFFIISHPLMWGVFSIANRSWMTWASLAVMGVVWSVVFLKTDSLRWPLISHFMVDIFNLSVFVFLNIYQPPVM